MTNGFPINTIRPQFFDADGVPLTGGTLTSYVANTSTPATLYSDLAMASAVANPVTLNARGEAPSMLYGDPAVSYDLVLKDADGVTIYTIEDFTFSLQATYVRTAAEIAATVTPTDYTYPPGDIRRYGGDPTGAANSVTAATNAISAAGACFIDGGTYKFSTAYTPAGSLVLGPTGIINATAVLTLDYMLLGETRPGCITGTLATRVGIGRGTFVMAPAASAIAWGNTAQARGSKSIAFGLSATASGSSSVAIGDSVTAPARGTIAIGKAASAGGAGASTTTTGALASGATSIPVAASGSFVVNDLVRIALSDGSYHDGTIGSIPDAATIIINEAIPAGKTAGSGAAVAVYKIDGVAIGNSAEALGERSIAIGYDADVAVANTSGICIGRSSNADGVGSVVVAASSTVAGDNSQNFGATGESISIASLTRVGRAGNKFVIGIGETAVADGDLVNNTLGIWADLSGGTKYIRIKHKDSTGTVRSGTVTIA